MILAYGTFLPPLFFLTFVIHRAWKRNDYIFFLYFKARIFDLHTDDMQTSAPMLILRRHVSSVSSACIPAIPRISSTGRFLPRRSRRNRHLWPLERVLCAEGKAKS